MNLNYNMKHYFILFILFLLSCKTEIQEPKTNWQEELLGYGEIGIHPDSLTRTFYYFGNRPMDSTKYNRIKDSSSFRFFGDTVFISNTRILAFTPIEWWEQIKNEMRTNEVVEEKYFKPKDSSAYSISKKNDLIILTKVYGAFLTPRRLFLKMASKEKSQQLTYFNYTESYKVNLQFEFGNDTLKSYHVQSSFFGPQDFIQLDSIYNRQDSIVINRFINLLVDKRYDSRLYDHSCNFPRELKIDMIYNDSVFSYNANTLEIEPYWLAQYFDYKLVKSDSASKIDISTSYPLYDNSILLTYPKAVGIPDFSLKTFEE